MKRSQRDIWRWVSVALSGDTSEVLHATGARVRVSVPCRGGPLAIVVRTYAISGTSACARDAFA
jgi:hypothetical protein